MNTVNTRKRIHARLRRARNPFARDPVRAGGNLMHPIATNVDDRVRMVKSFTYAQCNDALWQRDLQKGVIDAIYRRLRELERTS